MTFVGIVMLIDHLKDRIEKRLYVQPILLAFAFYVHVLIFSLFFFSFLICFLFLCFRWGVADVPLIFPCPADHVPELATAYIFLGTVKAPSINLFFDTCLLHTNNGWGKREAHENWSI